MKAESSTNLKKGGQRGKYNNACDVCHRKKIKCDGRKPVCDPCQASGRKMECTWTKDPARKPRTEQHFEAMHKRAENLCRVLNEHRKYAEYLESLLDRRPGGVDFRASRPSIPDGLMSPSTEPDGADFGVERELDEGLSEMSDDPTKEIRIPATGLTFEGGLIHHYGIASPFRYNKSELLTQPSRFPGITLNPQATYVLVVDEASEEHYNPDFDWSRHLPSAVPLDRRSHDRALDLLFKFFTSWCLRLVPALFLRDMYHALCVPRGSVPPKTPHYSPMLHNALVALALAFLDDPQFRDLKSRRYFANKAKSYIEAECQKPNISVVQALSFIASFYSSQGDQTLGYLYFGMSARVSQSLGLNIDCTELVKAGYMEEEDRLDRNWANWTTFSQDVCWSLYVGRDFCVPAPDPDFPMPVVDTALDQMPWIHGPPDPQVPSQPNYLTKTFEATCELLAISRRIMDVINSLGKRKARAFVIDEFISEIDLKLNEWRQSLAPELEITVKSRPTATPHQLMLHMAYWWLFILLHRPFFHRKSRPIASTDREIDHVKLCRRAADNIMEHLATWRSLYSLRYGPITLIQILFSAGTVYLLIAIQASSGVRMAQKELGYSSDKQKLVMQYLQEVGASWKGASNISGILKKLMQEQLRPLLDNKAIHARHGQSLQVVYPEADDEAENASNSSRGNVGSRIGRRRLSASRKARNVSHPRSISGSQTIRPDSPLTNPPISPVITISPVQGSAATGTLSPHLQPSSVSVPIRIASNSSPQFSSTPYVVDSLDWRAHGNDRAGTSPISRSPSSGDGTTTQLRDFRDPSPSTSFGHSPLHGFEPLTTPHTFHHQYQSSNDDGQTNPERDFQITESNHALASFNNHPFYPTALATQTYPPNELSGFPGMLGGQTIPQEPFCGPFSMGDGSIFALSAPSPRLDPSLLGTSFEQLDTSETSPLTDQLSLTSLDVDISMDDLSQWFSDR